MTFWINYEFMINSLLIIAGFESIAGIVIYYGSSSYKAYDFRSLSIKA